MCGVKPPVSQEAQCKQHICGAEAKRTLHTCEALHGYLRTYAALTRSASIRTGVNELMTRFVLQASKIGKFSRASATGGNSGVTLYSQICLVYTALQQRDLRWYSRLRLWGER
jgi:hypothetical protein